MSIAVEKSSRIFLILNLIPTKLKHFKRIVHQRGSHNLTMSNNNNNNKATEMHDIEKCKAIAASLAVEHHINEDCIVGIGSGSTMTYVLQRLTQRIREKNLSIKCIPTSYQARELIYLWKLPMTDLDCEPVIDVTIDGADEVDKNLTAIKGGGACLTQEKIVAFASKKMIVVADYRKNSTNLCENWTKGIPIEVLPMACNSVRHYMAKTFRVKLSDIVLRNAKEKAGPVITDNGNFVLDWKFNPDPQQSWKELSDKVKLIPGVVETGIFADLVSEAYFGCEDGNVQRLTKDGNQRFITGQ